jgi:hypothetical protein
MPVLDGRVKIGFCAPIQFPQVLNSDTKAP